MTIQELSKQHRETLAQLAGAYLKAKDVATEQARLALVAEQVAADVAQLEQAVSVLRLTLQVLEEMPANAPENNEAT